MTRHVVALQCDDQPGIVRAVSTAVAEMGGNIVDSAQFADQPTGQFSLRMEIEFPEETADGAHSAIRQGLARFDPVISFRQIDKLRRAVVMVSIADHCLLDILYHRKTEELPVDIVGIVSNHESLREVAEGAGIPFTVLPISDATKSAQEEKLREIVSSTAADFLILARYMQILSDRFCATMPGRIINIHHSFLPGFKGARPYRQAFQRGVKLIGATAHYVTADLDEGPIIEQDVERVSHKSTEADLIRIGRDVERRVLTRAISRHAEDRVFLVGNRTIVFE